MIFISFYGFNRCLLTFFGEIYKYFACFVNWTVSSIAFYLISFAQYNAFHTVAFLFIVISLYFMSLIHSMTLGRMAAFMFMGEDGCDCFHHSTQSSRMDLKFSWMLLFMNQIVHKQKWLWTKVISIRN